MPTILYVYVYGYIVRIPKDFVKSYSSSKKVGFDMSITFFLPNGLVSYFPGHSNCSVEQFACHTETYECVALNWLCDDNPDCSDASDETECSKSNSFLL